MKSKKKHWFDVSLEHKRERLEKKKHIDSLAGQTYFPGFEPQSQHKRKKTRKKHTGD